MSVLKAISPERAAELIRTGAVLVDVRESENTRASVFLARGTMR